jgi:hypothetical protein
LCTFLSEDEFRTEAEAAGFAVQHSIVSGKAGWSWALLRKAAERSDNIMDREIKPGRSK